MSDTYDAIVVGAGIVGSACAYACAIEGMRVALIEGGVVGGGATGAGMGHIVVMDDSAAQFELTRYSRDLWKKLAAQLPHEAEYRECGTIWVAAGEEEMAAVERKHEFYRERGVETKVLNAADLYSVEPHLRPGLSGGFLVPEDAVVYAPAVCRFLMQSAAQQGVTIYQQKAWSAGAGRVLLGSDGELSSARIVNATGSGRTRSRPAFQFDAAKAIWRLRTVTPDLSGTNWSSLPISRARTLLRAILSHSIFSRDLQAKS